MNNGRNPLYIASYHDHIEVVGYLVENGADRSICLTFFSPRRFLPPSRVIKYLRKAPKYPRRHSPGAAHDAQQGNPRNEARGSQRSSTNSSGSECKQ